MRQVSVEYQEAQRAEAQEAWSVAASAYLQALSAEPERCAGAVEDLKRLTQLSADLRVRVIWGIALVAQGRWDEAEVALSPLPESPLNLSRTITQRWPQLKQRRGKDGSNRSVWVRSLSLIDRALSMGFAGEAITLADRAVAQISSPEKSALVLYEAGRLGILHQQVTLGVMMMRRAIELKEILRDRARKLVDEALTEQRAAGDELEELLELRVNRVQDIGAWASALIAMTPASQRVELASTFAQHTERGLRRSDVATHFYVEAILSALQISDPRDQARSRAHFEGCVEALVRLALMGSTDAERALKSVYERSGELEPLERYLKTLAQSPQHNKNRRGYAAHELAQLLSLEGRFEEVVPQVKLALSLSPELIDLRGLIKQARSAKAWEPLDRLLSLQLNLTNSVKKRQAILTAQANTRRARQQEPAAYLALVGALSLGAAPRAELHLNALLRDPEARERVVAWLTREGASEVGGWVDDVLQLAELLAGCLAEGLAGAPSGELGAHSGDRAALQEVPDELSTELSIEATPQHETPDGSTADDEAGLFVFDFTQAGEDSLNAEGEGLIASGEDGDPVGALLAAALRHEPGEWRLAMTLLEHLEAQGRWDDWVEWVMTSPKARWPEREREELLQRAVELSKTHKTRQLSTLLRDVAESLTQSGAPAQERLEAWSAYLDEHPADRHALETFAELARAEEAWGALASRYEAALAARQTGKVHLLELIAELYEERLHDEERAAERWAQLLAIKPSHERAGLWLSLYLSSQGRWSALVELCLESWLPSESERATWRESLLQAYIGLEQLDEAMSLWAEFSEERTQKLYVPSLLTLAERAAHGPAILTLLEADRELAKLNDPSDAPALDTSSQSDGSLDESLDESLPPLLPTEEELMAHDESLAGIQSVSEHFSREADELRRVMQSKPKVPERLRLKARALTYMSPELDSLSAISAWRELRALDPRDVEATLALIELYAASGRRDHFDELAEYAERWCGVDEGMRRALTQAALSYEARFEDDEEAFRCWSVLLERAPQLSERALVALERLAKRAGLWSSFDERWVKYAERSSRPTERARALLAQTALCAGPLHHWQIALELLPPLEERRSLCQTVRALYYEVIPPLRKWPLLVERELHWAEEMAEGPARAERLSRVAELLETRLEDPQGALQCYELAASMSSGARSEELTRDVSRLSARLSTLSPDELPNDSAEP